MTRKKFGPPTNLSANTENILNKLGISHEDVLAESTEEVLAAKMVIAGFIDQTMFFLENLKKSILTSPGGLDAQSTELILTSCIRTIEHAHRALAKYTFIRNASRQITKLKLSQTTGAPQDQQDDFYDANDDDLSPPPDNDAPDDLVDDESSNGDHDPDQTPLPPEVKKKMN